MEAKFIEDTIIELLAIIPLYAIAFITMISDKDSILFKAYFNAEQGLRIIRTIISIALWVLTIVLFIFILI